MKSQKIPVIQFNQAPLLSTCTLVTNTGSYLNIPTKKKLRLRQSKQLPNIFKRCMQNPVKHLSCSLSVKKMNIFRKCSFLHVWKSSEYTSAYKRSHIAKQTCKQTFLYEGNTGILWVKIYKKFTKLITSGSLARPALWVQARFLATLNLQSWAKYLEQNREIQ